MKRFLKEESLKKLEDTVTEIEKSTSAEIVVAIAKFSESYRDVPIMFGYLTSMIFLGLVLAVPWDIPHFLVIPIVIIGFFIGFFICSHSATLMKLLTGRHRRERQTRRGAKLAFFEEQVSATRERTGILFYLSIFEKRIEILPDLGIDGKIPREKWNKLIRDLNKCLRGTNPVDKFTETLLTCIDFLNKNFPPDKDNPDEIPNRPRIRG